MKIHLDNKLIKTLANDPTELLKNPLVKDNQIAFSWPGLLGYLGLEQLFTMLPAFDKTTSIFETCHAVLQTCEDRATLLSLYDHLFAKNLTEIKDLPEIDPAYILDGIKKSRNKSSFPLTEALISPMLTHYEKRFKENASETMHDLILNLGWDRMCVCLRHLFDLPSANLNFLTGLAILRECLIESYIHIKAQGRTSPGIYRLVETLFFYEVREENLQKHTAADWSMLSESFPLIQEEHQLIDFSYIDEAIVCKEAIQDDFSTWYLTLESTQTVESRLNLARYIIEKIEEPGWNFSLQPKKIVSLF